MYEETWLLHFETENVIDALRTKLLGGRSFDLNKAFYEELDRQKKLYVSPEDVS